MFRREVGLPPKVFARLARFGRVLHRIDTAADVDWADLAISTAISISRTSLAIFASSPASLHRRTCATERHETMCG
jgi:hypothetical protein